MAIFDASLYEPVSAVVTADTTAYTADNTIWPTADGGLLEGASDFTDAAVNANIIFADLYEPVATAVTVDTTLYTADETDWPTADGGILIGAADTISAEVITISVPEGGYYPPLRPFPVEGVGYGILPELEGEGFGTVIVTGVGIGTLAKLVGAAIGAVGVAGHSAGQLVIRAVASGERGAVGTAVAVFKDLSIASNGTIGVHGKASGMIVQLEGAASGCHDDDEAAIMTFLLAA